jgi:hypothetical protein
MSPKSLTKVALRLLQAMAYDRNTFKDRIEEHISGAWLEFYKARLAIKNGQTEWVDHWMKEVKSLLDRNLITVIKHEVRGFKNRRKAFDEVVAVMKPKDRSYQHTAEHVIKRDFKLQKLQEKLDSQDFNEFWVRVQEAADAGFHGV